jgi:hypothetical protein
VLSTVAVTRPLGSAPYRRLQSWRLLRRWVLRLGSADDFVHRTDGGEPASQHVRRPHERDALAQIN